MVALTGLCVKIVTRHVSVFQVILIRSAGMFLILSVVCKTKNVPILGENGKATLLIARGVVGSLAFIFLCFGTFELPLSEIGFLSNSYPGKVYFILKFPL